MKRIVAYLIIAGILPFRLSGQEKTVTWLYDRHDSPAATEVDILHLNLNIRPLSDQGVIEGRAVFSFLPLRGKIDSLAFYTPRMAISSIIMDDTGCRFISSGDQTIVYLPRHIIPQGFQRLTFVYTGAPSGHCNFIGWDDPADIKRKQIWAHRPFGWIPYRDDRLTCDIRVTFDSQYKVFTNGERVSVTDDGNGNLTWHYRMNREHPFFSTALVIGEYEYRSLTAADSTPLELWYYPGWEDHFEPTYRYTREMFGFLQSELRFPYPYELYREAPVTDYTYAAMETTTSTVFGDYLLIDPRGFWGRNFINVNAHELVHQWFGNCISHMKPSDVWLTESFATYYAKLFERYMLGEEQYQYVRLKEMEEVLAASEKDGFPVGHSSGGRARIYFKGSLVLDMMRYVMGDEEFKTAIKHYLESFQFGIVQTTDLEKAIFGATGIPMDWFFDQWIRRGGEPHYQVARETFIRADGIPCIRITVRQTQETGSLTGLFRMPVESEVHYIDGTFENRKEWIEQDIHEIIIPNPQERTIDYVLFDPGHHLLKKVIFGKTREEWSAQALRAPGMIDRYEALLALDAYAPDDKRDLLKQCFLRESFHLNKGEIIRQLSGDSLSVELMTWAARDPDALVRRALLESTDSIPSSMKTSYEKMLQDSCYINTGLALSLLCRSFPEETGRYLDLTSHETGWRGMNIRIQWLEIAIGTGNEEHIAELVSYCSSSYEFETRKNALAALQRLNYLDGSAAAHLIDACLYFNFRLNQAAREHLKYFSKQNRHRETIVQTCREMTLSTSERNTIFKLIEESP
ncbi:MAG: M1 family metallopeptidase [Bacteroidales bacterium]|nr:M1 family metallopeptidase [Bacteroidales bacterium]